MGSIHVVVFDAQISCLRDSAVVALLGGGGVPCSGGGHMYREGCFRAAAKEWESVFLCFQCSVPVIVLSVVAARRYG